MRPGRRRPGRAALVVTAGVLLGACGRPGPSPAPATVGAPPTAATRSATMPAPTAQRYVPPGPTASQGCVGQGGLPDPRCTPGATDPDVTQADISSTICVPGWSARQRPPESVTEPIKRAQMRAYGLDEPLGDVELDHLVPLELGGAPDQVANLWPEPRAGPEGASRKDVLEGALHDLVCDQGLPLAQAQQAIATNWEAAYARWVG